MPAHDPFQPGVVQVSFQSVDSFTEWIPVINRYTMTAEVQVGSSFTWSTGVIGMEWSVSNTDYASAVTFSPTVTFTSSTKARFDIDVSGKMWVRFRVTTAVGDNDPAAKIVYLVHRQ